VFEPLLPVQDILVLLVLQLREVAHQLEEGPATTVQGSNIWPSTISKYLVEK
jgi:hypothetical protein